MTANESDNLRVSTREREAAVTMLGEHFADGRLPMDEYEERVSAAVEAKTRADLRSLFTDLPAPQPAFMEPLAVAPAPPPVPHRDAPPPVVASDRYRVIAGVLQIVLPFGIGRFYTGHTNIALAQLFTSFIAVGVIWSVIDGILMLINGGTDVDGRELRM